MRLRLLIALVVLGVVAGWVTAQMERNVTLDVNQIYWAEPPAAGTSGNMFDISATVLAMDAVGGDVVNGLLIDLTNADHTGGTLAALNIDGITGDAEATEYGIQIGGGYDRTIYLSGGTARWGFNTTLETYQGATLQSTQSANGYLPRAYAHAALPASPNGYIVWCTNCDPCGGGASGCACATGGASTGMIAIRVAAGWQCFGN